MTKRIMNGIMTISAIVVIVAAVLVTALMNDYSVGMTENELKNEAALIAKAVEMNGGRYLDDTDFGEDIRVTWITGEGRVIYDSQNDPGGMDDHSDRKEVAEAVKKGEGDSSRYSSTIMNTTMNHAVKLEDGTVIRVSAVRMTFWAQMMKMLNPLLIILAVTALFSIIAAIVVSKSIVRPINDIDLNHPKIKKSYKELTPLLDRLRTQNGMVNRQMEELTRSREQLSLITESMEEGMIIADPKMNVLSCNSSAIRLLGAREFAAGQSIYALNNSDTFRRCLLNALGGRRSECILKTGNAERGVIASPANSIDMVCGIVVFIMDVTEKQQMETIRREFTSNVSHELKTPLTTIYGTADMLANGMVKAEDVQQFGESIRSEADRLITLINDIVSLSKLDENSLPYDTEEVDIYALSEEIIERLRMNADEKKVTFELKGSPLTLVGNRTILDEIIYNLCDNAIKYNKEGGTVEVKVSHAPKTAIITVSDTGMGIPKKHIGRIFERFYRVDKSRSKAINGTGLGLSIVKHGVMYHNGTVRADSEPGKGTTFTVELPIEHNSN